MGRAPRRTGRVFAVAVWIACAGLVLLGSGCGRRGEPDRQGPPPAGTDPATETPSPAAVDTTPPIQDFEGTVGIVRVTRPAARIAVLKAVHTGTHPQFDRVVFEFEGDALPGYHIEYIDRPVRQCGSGDVAQLAGDAWLEIKLTPSQAHTDAGEATVRERERRLDLPVFLELESTCDFEADVTWVLGVRSPNRYRAVELSNPPRLVVDVKH